MPWGFSQLLLSSGTEGLLMTCHFVCNLKDSCCSLYQIIPLGCKAYGVIFLSIFHQHYDGSSWFLQHQPPSIRLSSSFSLPQGTYLDGNEFSSLIGLAGFLLQRTRCCHGFGWGCAAVFFLAPSVLGVSWVENAVIPLIFSLGGGIHPAATPLSSHWHTSTQYPPRVQTHSSTVKRILV